MPKPPLTNRNLVYRPASLTKARYRVLYGGAGSGKSVFVAQDYVAKLSRRKRRLVVFRKVAATIYNSVFALFKDILEAMGRLGEVKKNEQRMSFVFPNGSEILTAGLDDVQKMKSLAQPTDVWFEEATEADFPTGQTEEPDLAQIDLRLRGVEDGQITLTFNPSTKAAKIFEYLGVPTADLPSRTHGIYDGGNVYVQHTTHLDNPWVGSEYVAVFRRLGGVMQAVYERGELVAVDAPDQLIRYEHVKAAFERDPAQADHDGRQRLACDPARYGDDRAVIGRLQGLALVAVEAYAASSTTELGRRVASLAREHGVSAEMCVFDDVGLGAGSLDACREEGVWASAFTAGASPVACAELPAQLRFNNLRSQAYWYLRQQFEKGRVALSQALADEDKRLLQEELIAPRYRTAGEKRIEVEPKEGRGTWGIKARLGRSPDYADMLMMGVFAEHVTRTAPTTMVSMGRRLSSTITEDRRRMGAGTRQRGGRW